MTPRTADDIRNTLERHAELWNAKDRDGFIAHWKSVCLGEFTLEDPVGTPIKRGVDVLGEVWDVAFEESVWTLTIEECIVCGNEAALVVLNEGTVGGTAVALRGVEVYAFGDDGSVRVRTFYNLPEGSQYAEWTEQTGERTSA